jgi:hypothetical protein
MRAVATCNLFWLHWDGCRSGVPNVYQQWNGGHAVGPSVPLWGCGRQLNRQFKVMGNEGNSGVGRFRRKRIYSLAACGTGAATSICRRVRRRGWFANWSQKSGCRNALLGGFALTRQQAETESGGSMNVGKLVVVSALAVSIIGARSKSIAWAWGNQGHEVVAIIAADNLTASARTQVAKILAAASDTASLEQAMAAASVRPDTEFREEDRSTAPWHYIDICIQDRRSDLPARCPGGACVTAKLDEYANRLKEGNYDAWGRGR